MTTICKHYNRLKSKHQKVLFFSQIVVDIFKLLANFVQISEEVIMALYNSLHLACCNPVWNSHLNSY